MKVATGWLALAVATTVAPAAAAQAAEVEAEAIGLFDRNTAIWSLPDATGGVEHFVYGNPGDVPLMGDWDCDGIDTVGAYQRSDGFAYLRDSNTPGGAGHAFYVGDPGDIPLAGDFNGDGCDSISVYRPANQTFYVFHHKPPNGARLGRASSVVEFGNPGDKPVVGDWNGDGIDEFGLHRESTGFFYWRLNHTSGVAHGQMFYGDPEDRIVAGDWGIVDGIDSLAALRPTQQRLYIRHRLAAGYADQVLSSGGLAHIPVAGHFGDVPDSGWEPPAPSGATVREIPELSAQLAALMNGNRSAVCGTHQLAVRGHLAPVAVAHGVDMAANDFFSHTSPTRGGLADRLSAAGLNPAHGAENLAIAYSVEGLQQAWLDSPPHRAVFCDSRFSNVGVAVVTDGSDRLWGVHVLTD